MQRKNPVGYSAVSSLHPADFEVVLDKPAKNSTFSYYLFGVFLSDLTLLC